LPYIPAGFPGGDFFSPGRSWSFVFREILGSSKVIVLERKIAFSAYVTFGKNSLYIIMEGRS